MIFIRESAVCVSCSTMYHPDRILRIYL